MYINPFVAGIIATILVEMIIVFGVAIWNIWKSRKE